LPDGPNERPPDNYSLPQLQEVLYQEPQTLTTVFCIEKNQRPPFDEGRWLNKVNKEPGMRLAGC